MNEGGRKSGGDHQALQFACCDGPFCTSRDDIPTAVGLVFRISANTERTTTRDRSNRMA
jgi:hypothetical protein